MTTFEVHLIDTCLVSRKEICLWYNCCDKTARHYLRMAGITHRRKILPIEFEMFKKIVGEPIAYKKVAQ
jgi:hypothetical protein